MEKISVNVLTLLKCNWKIVINMLCFIYYCSYLGFAKLVKPAFSLDILFTYNFYNMNYVYVPV